MFDKIFSPIALPRPWRNWQAKQEYGRAGHVEQPFRQELFTIEQIKHHGRQLAEQHEVVVKGGPNQLLSRLNKNEKILRGFNQTTLTTDLTRQVTPAAEWLLDNAYLVEEQARMARRHLPRGYSRELPRLVSGSSVGFPRVYDLVLELISHVDAQLDEERLGAFIAAYQTVAPLKLGELWAVPIMLRLALIENLRRITVRLNTARRDRDRADQWIDELQAVLETEPANLIIIVANMAEARLPTTSAFVTQFSERLSRMNPTVPIARNWLEQYLAGQGLSVEQLVQVENQSQAADQVSVSHSITSLRFLSAANWREFVESMSVVDQALRKDPANIYGKMDFATRDRYRHSIEEIARHGGVTEQEAARNVVRLAEARAREANASPRTAHVGFYLIDKGRSLLERAIKIRWPWRQRLQLLICRFPLSFYLGGISAILLPVMLAAAWVAQTAGIRGGKSGVFLLIVLVCGSQLGVSISNWLYTLLIKPRSLPRLDFSKGIPPDCRTMVVVPTVLSSARAVARLLESLEIHYLGNRDSQLQFALLTDFPDAAQETMPADHALLEQISSGIKALNQKYQSSRPDIFFLFHRPRRFNGSEGAWIGYERKRGKLMEFNAILRGHGLERFTKIIGNTSMLPEIRFVITLDTDTQLPRDAAHLLVGTIAHPLNRAELDAHTGLVHEGYGILQPRVGVSLPGAGRSWFVRLFAGDAGIDPYTRATSDIYQDLFNEGSFIGKGIYDVDAFEQALRGRFQENTILSHDLIESVHARSALVTDVELYEEHPSRYSADISRRHRWIRGDWQIAAWLLPRVPGPNACRIANPLSGLSQWKIFDNLRRSLVPAALLLLLAGNWVFFPELEGFGVLAVFTIIIFPVLLVIGTNAFRKPRELPWALHLVSVAKAAANQSGQVALTLVFLPYDAYVSLDGIGRTLGRMLFTHKKLLEWQTASEAENNACIDLGGFYRTMWIAPTLAAGLAVYLALIRPEYLYTAAPFFILWLGSPVIAWGISQPIKTAVPTLTKAQGAFLRRVARKTWRFFETFVTETENWLPPDNFQEHPVPVIASRTSPTNMGLGLLANLAACDFGYATTGQLVQRTQNSVATLRRLERYHGHFYNWYDTRTLKPLQPQYISTVDSGNLIAHLYVLSGGLAELADQKILSPKVFTGLHDTLELLKEPGSGHALVGKIEGLIQLPPVTLRQRYTRLEQIAQMASELAAALQGQGDELRWWSNALEQDCREQLRELDLLAPWLAKGWEFEAAFSAEETGQAVPPAASNGHQSLLQTLREKLSRLEETPSLRQIAAFGETLCPLIKSLLAQPDPPLSREVLQQWHDCFQEAQQRAGERLAAADSLIAEIESFTDVDFDFLFDRSRNLFAIGYNVGERRRDESYYDLLASEARLASFIAIAQGKVSQEHWFALGRLVTADRGRPVLISWSGSMFEYLMPELVLPHYENTLISASCRAVVAAQIQYGRLRGVPWGISESGYNSTDIHSNYQYRAFGIPGLGFKRGLAEDLVIAPYATVLAAPLAPQEACENLERLVAEGRMGAYGFYEAVDYTPSRMPSGETSVTIRSFMAHHQGMSLLALGSLLSGFPMQRRFLSHQIFKATELLLQERVPKAVVGIEAEDLEMGESHRSEKNVESVMRVFTNPGAASPDVHLLSNGRYHVMVSSAGGGYSRWQDLAVTRWREDATRDCWGSFCYVRDVQTGEFWSVTHQPTLRPAKHYEAIFTQARAEFRQRHAALELHTEISISPEDDAELRRITVTNHADVARVIEFTSYAEVVLNAPGADATHPAFGNLFVQTEFLAKSPAILCTRRARSAEERPPWLFHFLSVQGDEQGDFSFETDRARFIGRGRTLVSPAALRDSSPLSKTTGPVLDPIVAFRRKVRIEPGEVARIEIMTGVGEDRARAQALVEKYYSLPMTERLIDLAWTHSEVTLRHLGATEADAQLYGRLAGALIYANPTQRASQHVLQSNRRKQSDLWSYGISGDLPIVLLRVSSTEKMEIARQLVQAHAYWRMKGLASDLVILNEDASVYQQALYDQIVGLIASGIEAPLLDRPGGIFVRRLDQIPPEDRILLQSVARVVLSEDLGTLAEQVEKRGAAELLMPELKPKRARSKEPPVSPPVRDLSLSNELGGFTPDGREYIITLQPETTVPLDKRPARPGLPDIFQRRPDANPPAGVNESRGESGPFPNHVTPAPWSNVLANPYFGTVVTESGGGYTWYENSHEFRLTPWSNDPVGDTPGEAFYIRDEETGEFWSPTPLPARGATPYVIRHGFGYTVFEHTENGIACEMWVYVATDAPVKFVSLKLRNISGRARRMSITGYWEWVLGELRAKTAPHIQTEIDTKSGALLARNPYIVDFAGWTGFADVDMPGRTVTADRREILGRNGTAANPAAMKRTRLSGRTGAGLDPCAGLQVVVELAERQEREITFRLGAGRNLPEAQQLIQRYRQPNASRAALEAVWAYWNRTLGAVYVETPDPAVNVMANGWLLYQTLCARLWGRTGFYQSSGAFGFRDQLQDAMALVHTAPGLLRDQLLRAAARQFREGDVQHWWHPPAGRGVRTHFSDDFLWLPYATCRYVNCLQDTGVLDEKIAFLEGRILRPEEESYYDTPVYSAESGTLYEHCVRAIEHGLRFGAHGLPLIGCGDWNDGLNRVGVQGRGESVWLAFFLFDVLTQFAEIARTRHDDAFAARCIAQAEQLRQNIEDQAWDGRWYRRGYFDNGEPFGSKLNEECQIDSLPQSWAVLSGAAEPQRAQQAMKAVQERLVHRTAGLIQLFDPPFDKSPLDPGYIKGYLPGVRENGGQYTHGAIWAVMALAKMGDSERAWELFSLINPVNHGNTREQIAKYKVEPYVVAADVYALPPHTGRGGWTWYTGSAGWMYRLMVETLLGVHLEGGQLRLDPHMPRQWNEFKIHYRYRETFYHIVVRSGAGGRDEETPLTVERVLLDGQAQAEPVIPLIDDRQEHHVEIDLGVATPQPGPALPVLA